MTEPRGRPHAVRPADPAGEGDPGWIRAWTIAMDTLARVSVAAAAAITEEGLRTDSAEALTGSFADWAFVDLDGSQPRRSVAAREPNLALAALVGVVPVHECPLIATAMERCAPVVTAVDDEAMLGRLPGGQPVATAIQASSAAVAPVIEAGTVHGAITIVRCADSPPAGFVELGVLSQIADLATAAVSRLPR